MDHKQSPCQFVRTVGGRRVLNRKPVVRKMQKQKGQLRLCWSRQGQWPRSARTRLVVPVAPAFAASGATVVVLVAPARARLVVPVALAVPAPTVLVARASARLVVPVALAMAVAVASVLVAAVPVAFSGAWLAEPVLVAAVPAATVIPARVLAVVEATVPSRLAVVACALSGQGRGTMLAATL